MRLGRRSSRLSRGLGRWLGEFPGRWLHLFFLLMSSSCSSLLPVDVLLLFVFSSCRSTLSVDLLFFLLVSFPGDSWISFPVGGFSVRWLGLLFLLDGLGCSVSR